MGDEPPPLRMGSDEPDGMTRASGTDDAFGRALLDELEGEGALFAVERDDGWVEPAAAAGFFADAGRWPPYNREAMRAVLGSVLDIGCGAGRHLLHLEARGHECVGIDTSPGAVEVCRRRGATDVRMIGAADVEPALGVFDTILLLGGNLGLLGSREGGRELLRRWHGVTSERGRIVADTIDLSASPEPADRAYYERNRQHGRPGGSARLRIRYKALATPWFDHLFASRDELDVLCDGTGWTVHRIIEAPPPVYGVVLRKVEARS